VSNKSALYPRNSTFITLLAPGVFLYITIALLPILGALFLSFYKWSGGVTKTFIGFDNYHFLFTDSNFWHALKNNLFITVASIIGQVGIALVVATLFLSKSVRFRNLHRSLIFFPVVLAAIIIGFIWTMVYSRNYGLLNYLLSAIGLESWIKPWLDDPKIIMYSITAPIIWQYIGYYTVIISSGMTAIPKEIFEASDLDGATGWRKLFYIIYPMAKNTIIVSVMMCIAGSMKIFSHILIMTGGGPGNTTMVMALYAYRNSFVKYRLGFGSAASIGIMIVSLIFILGSRKIMGSKNDDQF